MLDIEISDIEISDIEISDIEISDENRLCFFIKILIKNTKRVKI
jgi:hypothetical protein